jgi:hypothetical protein
VKEKAFCRLLQKGNIMKLTRREFWELAGTGILAASMPKSVCAGAEGKTLSDYSFIPLTDVVDHLNPCFSEQPPGLTPSKSSTPQA